MLTTMRLKSSIYIAPRVARVFIQDEFGTLIELDDDSFLQCVYSLYGV